MKQAWTLLLLASFYMNCLAEPVTPQRARQIACEFFTHKGKQTAIENADIPQVTLKSTPYYIFNAKDKRGFVIIAGNDTYGEILGYADNGTLDENNMPANMREWLDAMARDMSRQVNHQAKPRRMPSQDPICPILATQWGQGDKNETGNAYNMLCPVVNQRHCPAGCVAVAMAQVMRHHRWPQEACDAIPGYENSGAPLTLDDLPQIDFDWDNMLNTYQGGESEKEQLAVAQLMRYCGQGALTIYYPNKAEAYGKNAIKALTTYFGYASSTRMVQRENYSEEEWEQIIYHELSCNRPVIYFGSDETSSHSFVCDGYDGDMFYHVNWGWGGLCDGYFKLSALDPECEEDGEVGKNYSEHQYAIVGITPNSHSGNNIVFVDPAVKDICVNNWDGDGDGELSINEAANVLSLNKAFRNDTTITSFKELRYFTGLKGIADAAFEGCTRLNSITIPLNVQSIGINAFHLCPKLNQITVVEENTKLDSRDDCNAIIETATSTLLAGCSQTIIPQSVTALGSHVFEDCTDLSEVEFSDELTNIGDYCFAGCSGIEGITFPFSLSTIGEKAFAGCTSLGIIFIDQPIPPKAAPDAFDDCPAIVHVPSGAKEAYSTAEGWCNLIIEEPQEDNYIYCEDILFRKPWGANLNIGLHNMNVSIGVQFHLTLPEGISIKTNERGTPLMETTDRTAGHTIHCIKQKDNSYTILLMSMTLEEIAGNNGIVFTIPIEANDSIPEGEYTISFDDISISTIDDNEDIYGIYPTPFTSKINFKHFLPGDVDHDKHINVNDVMMTVYHTLGKTVTPFFIEEADMDENNRIDIVDVMRVVQVVIRRSTDAYAPFHHTGAAMLGDDGEGRYTLHLDNPSRFTAMQLCLQPANGCRVAGIRLDENQEGRHQMTYSPTEDGGYCIVIYSLDGSAFSNSDTALLHIDTEGTSSELSFNHMLLITGDLQAVGVDRPTHITHIGMPTFEDTPTYNLAGQRVTQDYKGLVVKKGKAILTK